MKNFVNKLLRSDGAFPPAAIVLTALSFLLRFTALNQTEYGNGWDSYFYLVQIQAWTETGHMHSPEWTLFYPILWFVNLFSPDYLTALKITSALLASIFTWVVFTVSRKVQMSFLVTIVAATFTVFSPELTYFAAQWPKNLLGVIVLTMLLSSIWQSNWKQALFFLIVGFFCHRMTAVLGVGAVGFAMIQKHASAKFLVGLTLSVCLFLVVTPFLPGMLNVKDIDRLNHLITSTPQLAVHSFIGHFGTEKISASWLFELWLTFGIILIAIIQLVRGVSSFKQHILLLLALLFVLWMPFYYWEVGNAAYRFFHVGILLTPLFILFVFPAHEKKLLGYITTIIILLISFFSWRSYNPVIHDPNYALYKQVTLTTQEQIRTTGNRPELIIAHKSLAEFYSFTTKTDAMPWIPDYEIQADRLWRIAVLPYPKLFEHYTKQKPTHLFTSYFFVQEDQWQLFIDRMKKHETQSLLAEHLSWLNPNDVRPAFLRKK